MRKTIVFVTHDIDEAIKMGDQIAVMRRGELVQYSTPEDLLSAPASDFVSKLVGKNRSIKRLHLIRVDGDLGNGHNVPVAQESDPVGNLEALVEESEIGAVLVVDRRNRLRGIASAVDIRESNGAAAGDICQPLPNVVGVGATLSDALSVMLNYGEGYVAVLDKAGQLTGIITLGYLLELMKNDAA